MIDRWEVQTTDGVFLALRYSEAAAERTAEDFRPCWPQGVRVVKGHPSEDRILGRKKRGDL